MRSDSEFQRALDARTEAIGEAILPLIDDPVGMEATYWALLGLASAMRATIADVEDEEERTQGMKMAAHYAMGRQAELWTSQRKGNLGGRREREIRAGVSGYLRAAGGSLRGG